MTRPETDEHRIDRYLAGRWTLLESAVILDMSMRTLTSYLTKQTLEIKPRVLAGRALSGAGRDDPATPLKPRKRAKYGFPNLLQFVIARRLFSEGVERVMVQRVINFIADPRFAAAGATEDGEPQGSKRGLSKDILLILTGSAPQVGYFFEDQGQLIEAIKNNPHPLPQCAIFSLSSAIGETIKRLEAWERREPYIPKSQENVIDAARSAWIEAGATRLPSPLAEAISKAKSERQKKH